MNPVWIIVDDDRSIRWVLEKALNGAENDSASVSKRPKRSRRPLKTVSPQVLISDIRMPAAAMVWSCCSHVKHASHPGLPVIIMTAYFRPGQSAVAAFRAAPSNICPSLSTSTRRWI
jgi:two-component system nitrogen regulation response regulator GlnG